MYYLRAPQLMTITSTSRGVVVQPVGAEEYLPASPAGGHSTFAEVYQISENYLLDAGEYHSILH